VPRPPPPPHVKPPTSSSTRRTKWDYYAKRLATCSSDRSIKVFDASGDRFVNTATLTGHEGPVWQVSWAHPKFGVILASCSYDGSVLIHREAPQHSWAVVYEHKVHDSSVNSISWAPHEYGLVLACASSDGKVSILDYRGGSWYVLCFFVPACVDPLYHLPRPCRVVPFPCPGGPLRMCTHFQNDALGCNSVSWAPAQAIGSQSADGAAVRRLVTGACDNSTRIWRFNDQDGSWKEEPLKGSGHTGMCCGGGFLCRCG